MDIIAKTKELLATAEFKTGEFIYDQKCNIKIAKVCAELKKNYEKLGRLSYRKLKGMWVDENEFESIVNTVEALKDQLECLRNGEEDLSNTICLSDEELAEDETATENGEE